MNLLKAILSFAIIATVINSCDAFYLIPLTNESDTMKITFDCGKLELSLINWQGNVFDFYQNYEADNYITLNSDSLYVVFKHQKINCQFVAEESDSTVINFRGKRQIRTAFVINEHVNKGDTIKVYPYGYIKCNSKNIDIKEFEIIIKENLRGPLGS